jgi:hypothetical protein
MRPTNKTDNGRARQRQAKIKHKWSPIEFDTSQLRCYAECPFFIDMIVYHGWLNNIYTGDWRQNERLLFVRRWWEKNIGQKEKLCKNGKCVNFEQQLKLF